MHHWSPDLHTRDYLDLMAVMFCSGVNLLLAIVLFSTIVGEMLPVTNNTPLIGQLCYILFHTVD